MRIAVLSALSLAACALPAATLTPLPTPAQEFAEAASGSWSSKEQSVSEAYDWVESETRRIWPERDDGIWLYQENAIMGASPDEPAEGNPKDNPYFQIVVQVRDMGDGALHTTSYRVKNRAAAKGMWKNSMARFTPDDLGDVACMGEMQRVSAGFWKASATCPNGYKGGVKVESQSVRAPGIYVNWDRGFDAAGNHIWGPAGGGYIFKRMGETQ